jgi:hypothetical protein
MAPLHVMGFVVVLVALVQGAEEASSTYGAQDIFAAVKLDSMSAIKQALADGADINQRQPESGQTPLSECTRTGRALMRCWIVAITVCLHAAHSRS